MTRRQRRERTARIKAYKRMLKRCCLITIVNMDGTTLKGRMVK